MPPKDTQLSELQGAPSVADYGLITSRQGRLAAGVSATEDGRYSDAWNQARMAQYNNDYNYWLWQQQAEYNSPSNQVARLKAAGLNPNFNSIDGAGNLGSMPTSSANLTPSIGRNRSLGIQAVLGEVNSIIGAMSSGVESLSKLSDMPPIALMGEYRDAILKTARARMRYDDYKAFREMISGLTDTIFAGGKLPDNFEIPSPFGIQSFGPDGTPIETGSISFSPSKGIDLRTAQQRLKNLGVDFDIKELVRDAKKYYNENIQPNEATKSEGAAGVAAMGKFINKIDNGEHMSWRDWVAFILAAASMKFL